MEAAEGIREIVQVQEGDHMPIWRYKKKLRGHCAGKFLNIPSRYW
jgi:hypothetical protein